MEKQGILTKDYSSGFTLVELLVAIGLMAILLAIATPSFLEWRKNVQYKEAADGVLSALRLARTNAISQNRQNRVEFNPVAGSYQITQGDRSYDSSSWPTVRQEWVTLPASITMRTGEDCDVSSNGNIQFNPNGTASAGKICIMENTTRKYEVTVATSGRIRSAKP
jgi:type IV fimbrial biogenesis protein FimT